MSQTKGPFSIMVDEATGQQILVPATQGGASGATRNLLQTLQNNLAIALGKSAREYVTAYFVDCTATGGDNEIMIPAPVTGTLTMLRAVANFSPDAAMPFQASIGGIAVTGGLVTIQNGDGAGTVRSATPTANNAVIAGTSAVQLVHNAVNENPGHVCIILGFTLA